MNRGVLLLHEPLRAPRVAGAGLKILPRGAFLSHLPPAPWDGRQPGTQVSGTGVTALPPASGLMNFMMHDRHTGPAWNVLMWTMLFLGQGIQVSLYCQEWYARRHCPLPQVRDHDPHSAPHPEGHTPLPSSQPSVVT